MRFAFSLAIDLPRTLPRPLAYLLTPEELRTYLERQLDRADIPPAAFKPDHWLQLNAVYRAAAGEDPDPDPSRKDSLIHQLADTLAAAVARVTLAHAEGDPILYAWIPSARAALLAVRAANIPRTAADDDRRDHGTACASCGCPLTDPDSPFCEDCEDLDPADRRRLIEDQIRDAEQASAPVDSMEGGATR